MSENLTPRQQVLLWDLISRGGSALQKDLRPEVTPKDREPLVRAKMISVGKTPRRALTLTVEERGWNHIASVAPTLTTSEGSKYDRPILQFVLTKMQAYVTAKNVPFADLLASKRGKAGADEIVEPVLPPTSVEAAIRLAFFEIAGRPARNQVRLRKLRDRLANIDRDDLDHALVDMHEAKRARFSTLSNPPDIAEEGDAALTVKNIAYHTIWID